jgi:hypothetical protein
MPSHLQALRRFVVLLPILGCCVSGPGCASWRTTEARRWAWSLPSWRRSEGLAEAPTYDQYAADANNARPPAGTPPQPVDRKPPQAAPASHAESAPAPVETTGPVADARSGERARSRSSNDRDSSIRVTLGRPESLPTVADPEVGSDSLLASASAPSWKRAGEPITARRASAIKSVRPSRQAPESSEKENPEKTLQHLLADVRARLEAVSTYQVDITRIEQVGGQLQKEEDVVLSVRRNPRAVLLQWVKGPSKGREVIYSMAFNDRMMYVNMGNASLPLPRMSIPVDSQMALRNSRHPISEAGFDTIVNNLLKYSRADSIAARAEGHVVYKRIEQPEGMDHPCHRLERVSPQGETWVVFLDLRTLMPALVSATRTSSGELIERYVYRNFRPDPAALASADAFDPDKRWGESKGLLSRLAKAAGSTADANPARTTTR